MNQEIHKLAVQIYGIQYNITTTEDVEYVKKLANDIDIMIRKLMLSGGMSVNHAFLLACLSMGDALNKSEEFADNLRKQITEYSQEASKLQGEINELRKELNKYKKEKGASLETNS